MANKDFDLKGDIVIDSSKAIDGLVKLSKLMDNIVKKLNSFEKSTIGSKIAKALSVQDKIISKTQPIKKLRAMPTKTEEKVALFKDLPKTKQEKLLNYEMATRLKLLKNQQKEESKVTREKQKQLSLNRKQNQTSGSIFDKIFNIKNTLIAITTGAMAVWVNQMIKVANKMVAIDVRFKALSDNATLAANETRWIYENAVRLRQPILDAAEGYSKFFAATKAQLSSKDQREIYEALLQTSTVMHIMPHQFKLISLAAEQMASKGTISTEELRRQMGEHIPGAFAIAARAMNMTEKEFNRIVKRGEIFASDFLPRFGKQLKKEFGSGLIEALESPQSKVIALQNAITKLKMEFAEYGFAKAIGDVADDLRKAFESESIKSFVITLGALTEVLAKLTPAILILVNMLTPLLLLLGGKFAVGKLGPIMNKGIGFGKRGIINAATVGQFTKFSGIKAILPLLGKFLSSGFFIIQGILAVFPSIISFFANFNALAKRWAVGDIKQLAKDFLNELLKMIDRLLFSLPSTIYNALRGKKRDEVLKTSTFYDMFGKGEDAEERRKEFAKAMGYTKVNKAGEIVADFEKLNKNLSAGIIKSSDFLKTMNKVYETKLGKDILKHGTGYMQNIFEKYKRLGGPEKAGNVFMRDQVIHIHGEKNRSTFLKIIDPLQLHTQGISIEEYRESLSQNN